MTGRFFDASEAKQYNLITHIYEDPMDKAIEFAEALKLRSPDAVASTKLLINKTWLSTLKQALNWETKLQRKLIGRHNQRAAVSQSTKGAKDIPYKNRS